MGNKLSKKFDAAKITNDLDLGYLDLKSVPGQVKALVNLKNLNLDGNQLKTLDKTGIENLTVLETLGLAGNQLTLFPQQMIWLTQLTQLNISFNKISELPDGLFAALPKLKSFDCRGNKLTKLPDNVGDCCPNLKVLMLDKNQFLDMPMSLGKLQLRTFTCKNNPFKKVPLALAQIQGVEVLDLSEGEIRTFDVDVIMAFSKNKTLMELNLSRNLIKEVPEQMIELFQLRTLDLTYNPVQEWPEKVKNMMNLKFQFDEEMRKKLWAK